MGSGAIVGGGELDWGRRSGTVSTSDAGDSLSWRDPVRGWRAAFCVGVACCFKNTPNPPSVLSSEVRGVVNSIVCFFAGGGADIFCGGGPAMGPLMMFLGMFQLSGSIRPPDRVAFEADTFFL